MNLAAQYITEHLHSDIGIEEVANKIGISGSYFCLLFKNRFAMTFVEYVTQQRIEAAKFMLTNSDKSITVIGSESVIRNDVISRRYFRSRRGCLLRSIVTGAGPKCYEVGGVW